MAGEVYILDKIKIGEVVQDLIARTNGQNCTVVNKDGTEASLATVLTDLFADLATKQTAAQVTAAVNAGIDSILNGAPETYDTLKEIADYITAHQSVADALNSAIGGKVDKVSGKGLSTNDLTDELVAKINSSSASATFTNSTPTVNSIGGIAAGTTFDKMPIPDVLNKLLYPWVAPVVTAVINTPANGGVVLQGITQTVTKITVNVTKKSASITKVEIFDGATSLGAVTENVANGGSFPFTVNVEVTTNKYFTAKVTDSDGKTTTANTGTFNFVNPYFYGALEAGTALDLGTVMGLTEKVEAKSNKSVIFNCTNQCMVFAYPATYGGPSKIIDPNNFDITASFTKSTVELADRAGYPVNYTVLVSSATTVSNFRVTFNH